MFGSNEQKQELTNYALVEKGTNITRANTVSGNVPVVGGGLSPSCYHNVSNRDANIVTISASGANAGYVNYWDVPIFASDCNTIKSKNTSILNNIYLYHSLVEMQDEIFALQRGSGQPHVYASDIEHLRIHIPNIEQQELFADFAQYCDKLKFKAHSYQNSYKELMFKKKMTTLEQFNVLV